MNQQLSHLRTLAGWRSLCVCVLALVLAGCADQPYLVVSVTPVPGQAVSSAEQPSAVAALPLLPHTGPDLQGGAGGFHTIDGLAAAAACLSDGQPVYGVMQANANVRTSPAVDGCRLGRAPAGTVVRVEGLYEQSDLSPLLSLNRLDRSSGLAAAGYTEDIQPLFVDTCGNCHGDLLQNAGLKVTEYDSLLAGSTRGPVVVPGKPEESFLWHQISTGVMPLAGALSNADKRLIYDWIRSGAPENRPEVPSEESLWARISPADYNPAANECADGEKANLTFVNSTLIRFASCAAAPVADQLADLLPRSQRENQGDIDKMLMGVVSRPFGLSALQAVESVVEAVPGTEKPVPAVSPSTPAGTPAKPAPVPAPALGPARTGISAAALGLPAPSDDDPWMVPQGGFCIEQRLQAKLENNRGITSLAFAPDGRLFMGLDSPTTGPQDPNILFDAFHPSRSIGVYD
ncbi:MAG: c-type cytochrome domain-containing protein, partial [Caldilineaceae bacterium]